MCVTLAVFTDCESCTRPTSTNAGSMKADECGLTRGTCFIARRLELHAVAGLLWISWSVLGGADFSVVVFFAIFFFFEHTRPAASMRPPCLIYLSTSNEVRPRERSDEGRLLPVGKKPLHTGVRTGCYHLIGLSVCVCACVTLNSSFLLIARAVRGRFAQTRDLWKRASMG